MLGLGLVLALIRALQLTSAGFVVVFWGVMVMQTRFSVKREEKEG